VSRPDLARRERYGLRRANPRLRIGSASAPIGGVAGRDDRRGDAGLVVIGGVVLGARASASSGARRTGTVPMSSNGLRVASIDHSDGAVSASRIFQTRAV
jgi:hypothetical protein